MNWKCSKCGRETPANMEHPRFESGAWKEGTKEKMFCWTCMKNLMHKLTKKED